MNWQSDPILYRQEMERRVRSGLSRTAAIWTPLFVLSLGTFGYFFLVPLARGELRLVAFALFGGISVLCGFQAISAMRDLREGPRTVQGLVARAWHARDSLFFRTYYIRLHSRQILRGDALLHGEIRNGDYVEATYFARSSVLIACDRIDQPPAAGSGTKPPPGSAKDDQVGGENDTDLRSRLGL